MKPSLMKIFFFISILLVVLAANFYVATRIYQLIPPNLIVRIAFITALTICIGSLFLFFPLHNSISFTLGGLLYRIGTAWIIAFAYFILIFVIIDLVKLSNRLFHFVNKDFLYTLTHHNYLSLIVIVGSVVLLLFIGNIKYHNKRRVHFDIETSKLSPHQKPIRVVGISDLHLGYTIGAKELQEWVQIINTEKPDLVVIGGDLIDNNVELVKHMELDKILRKLEAPMGVYACLGNHEYIAGVKESIDFHNRANIKILQDTTIEVTENLTLIGRDDVHNPNRKPLSKVVNGVNNGSFKLLLDHQPSNLEEAENQNIDLQFSGHTHNGQIYPITLVVEAMFENPHGMIKKGLTKVYVSSGLGIWGGKFRLGTQSEYVVFDIVHKQP